MKTIKCFLIFAGVTNAVNNYDTIDLTSLQLADNVRENLVYGEYVDLLVGRFDNRVNTTDQVEASEDVYVAVKLDKQFIDEVGHNAISLVAAIVDNLFDDVEESINRNLTSDELTSLMNIVPTVGILSTCLNLENGDRVLLNTYVEDVYFKTTVGKCEEDDVRVADYLVTYNDLHCNIRLPKTSESENITVELGPEQCNTLFLQTDTTIGIRNSVHIYSATFVGQSELIIGVKQDNATASHAVPIGRDYPIHNTAHLMMLFEGEDDDDTFSPECGSDTNVVSCTGRFGATSQMWTNNTFTEKSRKVSTPLGQPIYFSISPSLKIPGLYYSMDECTFGADERNFAFLQSNGCMYDPLRVKSYDEYVTATGTDQRFQFNAFIFTGPPFTGLQVTCKLTICLRLGNTNSCPTMDRGNCPDEYENGTK